MASEWKTELLGNLCLMKNGYAFKSKDFVSQGVPVIKIKNVKPNRILVDDLSYVPADVAEQRKKWLIEKGDILLTMTGNRADGSPESWVGKAAIFNEDTPYLLNQRVSALKAKDESVIDTNYLGYYLSSWQTQLYFIKRANSSGGQANISPEIVMNMPVHYPPLITQKRIVSILTTIDQKIKTNAAINDNLQQQAQSFFESWFMDYTLWEGKQPDDWVCASLGDFVEIKRGGSPRPIQDYLSDTGLRWLKISDVTSLNGPFVSDIKEHIKESGLRKTVLLGSGALVLSNSATPGIPKILDVDSCVHDGWLYFPKSQFSKYYLYLFFKHIRKQLVALGNGSVFTNLKTDILKQFPAVMPTGSVLDDFDAVVQPLFEGMLNADRQNRRLISIRDALLPRLMSGELDVTDIEI